MEYNIGDIRMFAGNFAPRGSVLCNGQILPIAQFTALFSLLGTTYGGNGTTTFAVPDLRGRLPMGNGQGPGLSPRVLGETGGQETVTLLQTQMPSHSHTLQATTGPGTSTTPGTNIWAVAGSRRATLNLYTSAVGAGAAMNSAAISLAGSGLPHSNLTPFVSVSFILITEGIYPARN